MSWQLLSYVAILFLISLLSVIVAYSALRLRDKRGSLPLGLLMLAVAEWSFTLAFEATAATIPAKVLWAKIEYLGITSAPVFLLLFALEFTHRDKWLKRGYTILYWIIPLISLALAFTNEWHRLIWISFTPIQGSNLIIYGHGAWFWIMVTYDYLVLFTATILLLRAAFRFRHVYRRQTIMLFVGMFPPWLMNILYVFDLGPPGWDLTPIGFALTGLLLTWSLARLQLLDLSPVARDKVIESMRDGMLALDAQNRIVDINPAAQKLIGVDGESAIGQHAEAILAKWTCLKDRHQDAMEAQGQVFVDGAGYIEWRTFPLPGRGRRPFGQLIILRDITERARAREKIKRRGEELETLCGISLAITAQLELDQLLQNVVEQGCHLLDARAGGIYLVDEARGDLELVVSHGYTRDYTGSRLAPGEGLAGRVLQSGEPLAVDDYRHWEGRSPDWEVESLTAVLGVPLKRGDQVIGVLEFAESGRAKGFDPHDLWLATLFANQAAIAIENAQLYRTERAARESADTLRQISRAVGSTLELDEVLSLILHQAKSLLAYDTASLLLFAGGQPSMVAVSGYDDEELVKTEVTLRLGDSLILQAMARDHRPIVIADVREDERWIWIPGTKEIRAWLGAPLLARGEMIGALMIDSTQPDFYTDADAEIAQALANQAAVALENARLYQAEQHGREIAEALQETARAVSASPNLDEVLPLILEQLAQVIEYDSCAVLLLDDGRFKVTAGRGFPDMEAALRLSYSADEDTVSSAVMRARRPLVIEDVQADPRWHSRPASAHIHGWIGVPLIVRDKVIGILTVDSRRPGAYGKEEGQLVLAFADQAAIAIENARLFEETRENVARLERTTRDLELVHQVSQVVSSSLDLTRILETTVEQMAAVFEADHSGILLFDEAQTYGQVAAEYPPTGATAERYPVQGYRAAESIIADREPLVIEDAWNDPLMAAVREAMRRLDIRSMLIVPLIVKGKVVGSIGLDAVGRQRRFSAEEVALAQTIANQVAFAIENARLYEETRRHVEELTVLHDTGVALTSTLNLDEVLSLIARQAADLMGAETVAIPLLTEDGIHLTYAAVHGCLAAELTGRVKPLREGGICAWVMRTQQVFYSAGLAADEREAKEMKEALGLRTVISAPMVSKGETVGAITAINRRDGGLFTRADLEKRLQPLANQAAIAIENARLFEAEQRRRQEAETLRQAALALTTSLDRNQVIERILIQLQQVVPYDTASIQLLKGERLEIIGGHGFPNLEELLGVTFDLTARDNPNREVMRTRTPLILEDAPATYSEFSRQPHAQAGIRSWLGVPLLFGNQLSGMIALDKHEPGFYTEEHGQLALAFAAQAAVAIENARLYEQVQRHAEELEQHVTERTRELAEAYERLQELDRLKSRFVADVSHELRTPAANIKLYLHLLERSKAKQRTKYVTVLKEQSDRLASLIQDILSLSRLDLGKEKVEFTAVNLNAVVEQVVAVHQPLAEASGLKLILESDAALPPVRAERNQLAQVVTNLVSNAINYTPAGQVRINTYLAAERGQACLQIRDTGMGIKPEDMPHLFERFYRGQDVGSSNIPGTGLGLAIVKEIVDLHRGKIKIESQPGEGSTFRVWLPLAESET